MTKRSFKQQLEHQNILVQTYNLKGVSEHGDDLIIVGVVHTCRVSYSVSRWNSQWSLP